ncbi:MAG TPA: gluconate 2-dehydrogenase subunit 3 family protein [Candidatus Acidoferrum sp.]|nr:gluconate 2-dehydrogenase subunit 3 family protein [Candidatus Acidoferrum sp.]
MSGNGISRRDILRTLAAGAAGGSVLQVIPAKAAEFAHQAVQREKSGSPSGKYTPKFFTAHQYEMLTSLCETILPKDDVSGGAVAAGAPEFIDLLTSENEKYQLTLGGGLQWLDSFCLDRYAAAFLECSAEQRKEVLDLIAFRKNAKRDATLSQGVVFFAFLRKMTCDGFYTSKIGITDLQYIGNTTLREFPGCPPLPEA